MMREMENETCLGDPGQGVVVLRILPFTGCNVCREAALWTPLHRGSTTGFKAVRQTGAANKLRVPPMI